MMIPVSLQASTSHILNQPTSSTCPTTTIGCLLKTAIADVHAGIHCKANNLIILFDEGHKNRSFHRD